MIPTVTITHTPADGTLASGATRPYAAILKANGWKWSRNLGAWSIPHSRDQRPRLDRITRTTAALCAAGATVEQAIENVAVDPAEREANRAARLDDRRDALTAKAARKQGDSQAAHERVDAIAGMIPLGQPILVGHHSEGRHRRNLDRIDRGMRQSIAAHRESSAATHTAEASAKHERHRMSGPATMRRIEKLDAEQRKDARSLADATPGSAWHEAVTTRMSDRAADLAYWRDHLAALELDGWKQWSAADFKKGDLVTYWGGTQPVVRVNTKSLSVQTAYSWTDTVPYDQVRGTVDAATE